MHLAKSKDVQYNCFQNAAAASLLLLPSTMVAERQEYKVRKENRELYLEQNVWSWSGKQQDVVVVEEEQGVAVIVGAMATAAASRSERSTIPRSWSG
jgi:hypothetical protein